MLTAIAGINWGDEGKGRMVDLLSSDYDIVARYQGGNNAGHTVINHLGKFILNLLPSGILRPEVVNVMGNGMVIDLEHLSKETGKLKDAGVQITPENLKISDRAVITLPYHVMLDCLEEERLGDAKFGSTRRGIAPVKHPEALRERLRGIVEWKNLTLQGVYHAKPVTVDEIYDWLMRFGGEFMDYITDTGVYLNDALRQGKKIMFEAQLGALRDIDFGIYPYTSSSSTIAAYAPIGAGIPGQKLDLSIGIMKAYSTCVGEGPFTVEMFGEEAEALRAAGGEYGAATGRPRRVGPFDVVASRYGVTLQGSDYLAITKMDVLSYLEKIPVCVAYELDGHQIQDFPYGDDLNRAKPVIEYLDGWNCDIGHCRTVEDLPKAAYDYVKFIENAVGCPIRYISVGAEREDYIEIK